MATYTKETALYDTGAIANDIANAGTKATSYITQVDPQGIWVTPSGSKPTNTGTGAGATGARINADGMEIFQDGNSVAIYGDYARIGKDGKANTQISPSEVLISAGNNINALRITPDGNTQTVRLRISKNDRILKGTTFTVSHPTNADSGSDVAYYIKAKVAAAGYNYVEDTIHITKGQTTSTTTVTGPIPYQYSATATQVTIKNTGSSTIYLFAIAYSQTATSPLTEVGGVLTIGQYPDVGSNTVFAVGNGTEGALSNALAVTSNGDLLIRGNQLNPFDVRSRIVWQPIGSTYPSQLVARQFGNFVFVSYKIGGVSLSASSTTAILSLYEDVRPANEAIVTANITDSNYATVGTGLVRFETGGWVYLVAPKSLSQTSGLYVMFTALYLI